MGRKLTTFCPAFAVAGRGVHCPVFTAHYTLVQSAVGAVLRQQNSFLESLIAIACRLFGCLSVCNVGEL